MQFPPRPNNWISSHTRRCTLRTNAAWILGLVIATLLLSSSIKHLQNPYQFLDSIYAYRILPRLGTEIAAAILPFVHIAISICLIARWHQSSAFGLGCFLFLLYAGAQISTIVRGIEIDCGCFSGFQSADTEEPIGLKSVSLPVVSALLCFLGWCASDASSAKSSISLPVDVEFETTKPVI